MDDLSSFQKLLPKAWLVWVDMLLRHVWSWAWDSKTIDQVRLRHLSTQNLLHLSTWGMNKNLVNLAVSLSRSSLGEWLGQARLGQSHGEFFNSVQGIKKEIAVVLIEQWDIYYR